MDMHGQSPAADHTEQGPTEKLSSHGPNLVNTHEGKNLSTPENYKITQAQPRKKDIVVYSANRVDVEQG